MKFLKPNRDTLIKIIVVLCALSALFYWYEIRPTQIKHDCSWVKKIEEVIPAKPAMNEDELRVNGHLESCKDEVIKPNSMFSNLFRDDCVSKNERTIEEYKTSRPAVPEKESWRQASGDEYKFCLHDKGL